MRQLRSRPKRLHRDGTSGTNGRRPAQPPATDLPDCETFSRIFETYYHRLMSYAISRLRDRDLAEDTVAETFKLAYLRWSTLRDPQAVGSWLFSIAHNVMVSQMRARARAALPLEQSPALEWWDMSPTPEEEAIRQEEAERLLKLLSRLSPREQEALSLRFDGGLSSRDIARILGTSEGNVRLIIFRALRRLRQLMQEEEAGT
ncbi:MAG TPA: RNA polymerase sigma factor [Dehalococcoidia bacterium]|nr:RNA polymerase sigma factor [Dehalococcoidia bacterium]